jgi:hypothetical protein
MHITSIPLVLSSLSFACPYFVAISTGNIYSAVAWGCLTTTSTLVHITKKPYHLHGPGNCIGWLYSLDVVALYLCVVRSLIDGWAGGPIAFGMALTTIGYAGLMFYAGQRLDKFVYDSHLDMSILSHFTVHLLSSFGGVGVLSLRALKNG